MSYVKPPSRLRIMNGCENLGTNTRSPASVVVTRSGTWRSRSTNPGLRVVLGPCFVFSVFANASAMDLVAFPSDGRSMSFWLTFWQENG